MRSFSKIILGIIFIFPLAIFGQNTEKVVRYGEFKSNNQDLWGQGGGFSLNMDKSLFELKWNKSGSNGGIATLAGMKFGGEINASTWGDIGSNFVIDGFTSGLVSIYYPFEVEYSFPDSATFNVGDKITIGSKYDVLSNSKMNIVNPSVGSAEIRMHVGFGFDVNTKLCLFGCQDFHIIPNINLPVQDFYLLHVDSSGLTCPCMSSNYICSDYDDPSTCTVLPYHTGLPGFCKIDVLPYEIPVAGGAITGIFNLPYNELTNTDKLYGKKLYASGEYNYLTINTDVFKTLSLMPIPIVSTVLGNLSNDYSIAGYGEFSYNIFDMDFPLKNYHKHEFSFEPTLYNKIRLSTKVNYEVLDPNGKKIGSGNDSIINYPLESEISIEIPCNSAFVDVLNYDYDIASTKNFSNHTYDSLSFEIAMSALAFSITLPKVVVVPKICFPEICLTIPYPCPTWKKPWKWCSSRSCTPAFCTPSVEFDGFYFCVGPLWEYNKQIGSTKFDWYNNKWEFGGFSPYVDTNRIYRLYPVEYNVSLSKMDIKCFGDNTGSVVAQISGGTPPFTIEWSNGATHQINSRIDSIYNLPADAYYLSVTDNHKCKVFGSVEVEQPALPLTIEFDHIENVKCFGDQTGEIQITSKGGTLPYNYKWTSSNAGFVNLNEDIDNLPNGNYFVNVSDKYGCQISDTAKVSQPLNPLSNTINTTDVLCFGENTGTISTFTNGGTPPYSYQWSIGDTLKNIQNLGSGNYYLTIFDAYGCQLKDTATIQQPDQPILLSINGQNATCFGLENGKIDLIVTGGTLPYKYVWANGENLVLTDNSQDLDNVSAGIYHVKVEDNNKCYDTISIKIDEPAEIITSITKEDVKCFGGSDASVDLTVSGGKLPYQFSWTNGSGSEDLSNIQAGFYQVQVLDAANCQVTDSITVSQPAAPLNPTIQSQNVACYGQKTGNISLNVIGGTSPYQYNWSNGDSISELRNLASGTYTVTITDANGCLSYSGKFIEQPTAPLDFTAITTDPSCFGYDNGKIQILAAGGTAPYYFKWDDTLLLINNSSEILSQLPKGDYHILVEDENKCFKEQLISISEPQKLHLNYDTKTVSCYGGQDGEIDLTVSGGTSPYKYQWSNGYKTENVAGLSKGSYTALVIDDQDCEISVNVNVNEFSEIIIDAEASEISCRDQFDGYILTKVKGGAGGYQYLWSTDDTTQNIYKQEAGFYWLKVTDKNNCEKTKNDIEIKFNGSVCINIPSSFTPNADGLNDTWIIRNIELYPDAVVKVFNRWGIVVFESNGYSIPWDGQYKDKLLPAATYYYIVDLKNGEQPYTGDITIVK